MTAARVMWRCSKSCVRSGRRTTSNITGASFKIKGCIEPRPAKSDPDLAGRLGRTFTETGRAIGRCLGSGTNCQSGKTAERAKTIPHIFIRRRKESCRCTQPATREVVIAETREQAWELAEKYVMVNYRDEYGGGWKHPLIGSQDQTPVALDSLSKDRFIVGNPDDCIAQIKRFVETFGVDHLICRLYFAGMPHDHIMTELKLLAKEVFPAFR